MLLYLFCTVFCTLNDKPNFLTHQGASLLTDVAAGGDRPVRPHVTTGS